jgi:hypothetical protein
MRAAQQAVRDAERQFTVRIRIAVPTEGLSSRLDQIIAWLDANSGAGGWTSIASSTRGFVNDALAVYFVHATELLRCHRGGSLIAIGAGLLDNQGLSV